MGNMETTPRHVPQPCGYHVMITQKWLTPVGKIRWIDVRLTVNPDVDIT